MSELLGTQKRPARKRDTSPVPTTDGRDGGERVTTNSASIKETRICNECDEVYISDSKIRYCQRCGNLLTYLSDFCEWVLKEGLTIGMWVSRDSERMNVMQECVMDDCWMYFNRECAKEGSE